MPEPYKYELNAPDPQEAFLKSFQIGNAVKESRAKYEKEDLIKQAFSRLNKPDATAKDYADLAMLLPADQANSVRQSFEMVDKDKQERALKDAGQLFSAFKSGNTDFAIDILDRKIESHRNMNDAEGVKFLETWRDVAKTNPKVAEDYFGFTISQMPGGDKVINSAIQLSEERRKADVQPFNMMKAKAEAIIKNAEAKFAPEKFGAELGLTQAQIEASKAARKAAEAAASKSGAEAASIEKQASEIAEGVIPPDKRPDAEAKFRKEYSDQTKAYQEVKSAYGRIISSEENAIGDLALIFGYMKILDPGSVVREGEFATAQNASGVPERIINLYNNMLKGDRLNEQQRNSFKAQAKKLYLKSREQEAEVRSGIDRIAKGYGLNPENIFYTFQETEPQNESSSVSKDSSVEVTTPDGQTIRLPNQEAANSFKKKLGIQ